MNWFSFMPSRILLILLLIISYNRVSLAVDKIISSESVQLGESLPGAIIDDNETKQLEKLYFSAINEINENGGKFVVWAGGDEPEQQKNLENAFKKRFPKIPIEIKVDLSKFHNEKINAQLTNNTLEPDVVILQTSNDFDIWKKNDSLYFYKPIGFNQQRDGYADPDGYYITAFILSFLPQTSEDITPISSYEEFLKPEFKNKLVLTYPHDDDAVLYVYDKITQKYGDVFLAKLAEQNPTFVRGTAAANALVAKKEFAGNLTGYFQSKNSGAKSYILETEPFITWTQRAAMFNQTKNKNAAKLFLSYISSKEYQSVSKIWPTRRDLKALPPYKELSEYKNTDFVDFNNWMADRKHVEEVSNKMLKFFGEVKGDSPLTDKNMLKRIK